MANRKDIFPFFELPREIRDEIYTLCTATYALSQSPSANGFPSKLFKITVNHAPLKAFQLVSRQFRFEYIQRTWKAAGIIIHDHYAAQSQLPLLPQSMSRYHLHEIRIIYATENDTRRNTTWLRELLNAVGSSNVVIKAFVERSHWIKPDVLPQCYRIGLREISEIGGVGGIEVYSYRHSPWPKSPALMNREVEGIMERQRWSVGSWTRGGGWVWEEA